MTVTHVPVPKCYGASVSLLLRTLTGRLLAVTLATATVLLASALVVPALFVSAGLGSVPPVEAEALLALGPGAATALLLVAPVVRTGRLRIEITHAHVRLMRGSAALEQWPRDLIVFAATAAGFVARGVGVPVEVRCRFWSDEQRAALLRELTGAGHAPPPPPPERWWTAIVVATATEAVGVTVLSAARALDPAAHGAPLVAGSLATALVVPLLAGALRGPERAGR